MVLISVEKILKKYHKTISKSVVCHAEAVLFRRSISNDE